MIYLRKSVHDSNSLLIALFSGPVKLVHKGLTALGLGCDSVQLSFEWPNIKNILIQHSLSLENKSFMALLCLIFFFHSSHSDYVLLDISIYKPSLQDIWFTLPLQQCMLAMPMLFPFLIQ